MSRRRKTCPRLTRLEDRLAPAVTATFANGTLDILGDAADNNIRVEVIGGQVKVFDFAADVAIVPPPATPSAVNAVRAFGLAGNDTIDFSRLQRFQLNLKNQFESGDIIAPLVADGGEGNDNLIGAADAPNELKGGDGDDTLRGGIDRDKFLAGAGIDNLFGGRGNDVLRGEAGDDTLNGGEGNDDLDGGAGRDTLDGGAGDDLVAGDEFDNSLDAGGQVGDLVKFAKSVPANVPLLAQFNVAANELAVNAGANLVSIRNPGNVVITNAPGDTQGAKLAVNDPANAPINLKAGSPGEIDNSLILGAAFNQEHVVQVALQILNAGPLAAIYFESLRFVEVEGSGGNDNFEAEPIHVPLSFNGGGGNDRLTVRTTLPAAQTANAVQVENRATIGHQNVEQVDADAGALPQVTATLAESADPVFVGAVVNYSLRITNTTGAASQLGFQVTSNYPVLRVTTSASAFIGPLPLVPIDFVSALGAAVGAVQIRSGATIAPVADGGVLDVTVAVLANRPGEIFLDTDSFAGLFAFPIGFSIDSAEARVSATTTVVAGQGSFPNLVTKNPTTGKPSAGFPTLVGTDASGRLPLFTSTGRDLDPEAIYGGSGGSNDLAFVGDPILAAVGPDSRTAASATFSTRMSRDGRFVVFEAPSAGFLASPPPNAFTQVYLRDLERQTTVQVSVSPDGSAGANNSANSPAVSDDGRFVVFSSGATNLVAGFVDNNATTPDLYLRDLLTGTTTLVSRAATGPGGANHFVRNPAISADGRFVVYEGRASNLVTAPAVPNTNVNHLYVFDRVSGATRLIDAAPGDAAPGNANVPLLRARLSRDGTTVVYETPATNVVAGFVNNNGTATDVYAYDLASSTNSLVSGAGATAGANNGATRPNVSADGRSVTFVSAATNLVPGATNGVNHVYLRDRVAGTTELIDVAADGTQGNGSVLDANVVPAVSDDGRFVAFPSAATNLVAGYVDGNADFMDVFVRDRLAGLTTLVNRAATPTASSNRGYADFTPLAVSADGATVLFQTFATNLAPEDTNDAADIFSFGGHLAFEAAVPAGVNATLRRNGALFELIDTATQAVLASRPAVATEAIDVRSVAGTLTVDLGSGDFDLPGGLNVVGTTGSPQLSFVGGAFGRAEASVRGTLSGLIAFDDLVVTYSTITSVRDTATVVNRVVRTREVADTVTVTAPAQVVVSGAGAFPTQRFDNPVASLLLSTGAGNDSVSVSGLPAVYDTTVTFTVAGGDGNDTLDAAFAIRRVFLFGGAGNDAVAGGAGNDTLADGPGDDALAGGAGNDTFLLTPGSADAVTDTGGSDTLDYSFSDRPVTVNLSVTAAQVISEFGDVLTLGAGVEHFTGSPFNDTVLAQPLAVARTIDGGGGVPGVAPGDRLVVNALGAAAVVGASAVQTPGFADINFVDVPLVQLTNAGGPPPVQATVSVNGGEEQRSRVTRLVVTFSAAVALPANPADAFRLRRLHDNAVVALAASVAGNAVTLTFTSGAVEFGSLADGRYELTILSALVTAAGGPLDGDGDGLGGDDFKLTGSTANGLYRLFGDANGDGTVNAADFGQFRQAFGAAVGSPLYLDFLDVDGNGVVNAFDFAMFRNRFGVSVP